MKPIRFERFTNVPNMIPTIDILFQLVIFFMLACQFAVVEQFPIALPDTCANAQTQKSREHKITMVTLMKSGSGDDIELAVGPEKVTAAKGEEMAEEIAALINEQIAKNAEQDRVVCLRIAKDIPFEQSQYVLQGVAQSEATEIQMAVLKDANGVAAN